MSGVTPLPKNEPYHQPRRWLLFTLLVLLGINTMNFFDRQVPAAVAEPLRTELQLDDTEYGSLTIAFLLFYAIVGVPLGRWSDAGRRSRILGFGVLLWSAMTALSGLATSYWSLFLMRLGVGVGEASCAPAANSLLGDLFPRERRARAISVLMLGLPIGLCLSSIVSGQVAAKWGWRAAFYVAAAPGLVLGVLAFFLPDPPRGGADKQLAGVKSPEGSPFRGIAQFQHVCVCLVSHAAFAAFPRRSHRSRGLARWRYLRLRRRRHVPGRLGVRPVFPPAGEREARGLFAGNCPERSMRVVGLAARAE
jgi:MFS family permease